MSRGLPSMTALLGILAVAGYQNRDKIAEMLGGRAGSPDGRIGGAAGDRFGESERIDGRQQDGGLGGLGGLIGGLAGSLGGGMATGGGHGGLLGELVDRFRQNGQGDTVDSWVGRGPNQPIAETELASAIGPDTLADLTRQTGLSESEILSRLSRTLPEAVDQYTPEGRLPDEGRSGAGI